ncbi:MAG TPA: stage II sporulation protein M [Terriglobales bacterium]|nr:stage II sporulation protein M [Terriglobales bacterium]
MISTHWLEKRQPYWRRLEALVEQSGRRGVGRLSRSELQELGLLYRQIASDLSTVREDPASRQISDYLNQLLGRAHNLIYMGRKTNAAGIVQFFRVTYPRLFRENLAYPLTAFLIFLAAAIVGTALCFSDPGFERYFLGGRMIDTIEQHRMWTQSVVSIKPLASSFILTNNISVACATFAMGILAGLGTVYMLFFNGLLIGVIGTACWQAGMSRQLWSFVAPHGVLELPAIFIAGGAGLLLARGLLFPGTMPRRDSVVEAGGRAVRLVLGVIPMLVVAGFIEGYLSPSNFPVPLKFALGAALGLALVMYLASGGENAENHAAGERET